MVEIDDFEMLYVPVPKAGCTSVKTAIAPLLGLETASEDAHDIHPQLPTRRFNAKTFDGYRDLWRFTVVRDPIARLLSVYTDLVQTRNLLASSASLKSGKVDLPMQPDPDFFFQNLDAYRTGVSVIKHHAMKQIMFTGPDLSAYDMVYDVSELGALGRDLSLMTGRAISLTRALNASKTTLMYGDLSAKTRAVLTKETAPDYAALSVLEQQAA